MRLAAPSLSVLNSVAGGPDRRGLCGVGPRPMDGTTPS